jgi:hypothetical protein
MSRAERTPPDPVRDRRRDRRYECLQPLRVRSGDQWLPGAVTADISTGGICIQLPETFECGSMIELTLDWPGLAEEAERTEVMILGRVLRSEAGKTAIAIEKYKFTRNKIDALSAGAAPNF